MDHFKKFDFELDKDLSDEDFQDKLYQWLEEQGVLPGVRTYLRHQLISALKHTHLGSGYRNRKKNHLSPKIHACNLLVAEYLLEQNYHFTLSVFCSEEPHLGRLPSHFPPPQKGEAYVKFFKEKDVEDILESLNLGHSTKFVKKVVDIYFRKEGLTSISLLKAIFQALVDQNEPTRIRPGLSAGKAYNLEEKEDLQRRDTSNKSDASHQVPHHLQENNYQLKASMVQEDGKFDLELKQKEFERKVQEEVQKLYEEMENKMAIRRKSIEESLMVKQQQLIELMNFLKEQQDQLQLRCKELQKKEDQLNQKEMRLENTQEQESIQLVEKHNEIIKAQQKLEEDFRRMNQEKNAMKFMQKELEVRHSKILEVAQLSGNSQPELDISQSLDFERLSKNERNGTHHAQQDVKHNFSTTDPFQLVQSVRTLQEHTIGACQRIICQLKDKNEKLQIQANEQQSKINALSLTATSLNSQLKEATAALRFLSSQGDSKSNLHHLDTSQHITFPTTHLEETAQLTAEGHRQNETFANKDKIHKNKHLEKGTPKRYQRSHVSFSYKQESDESICSVASSPTEEILREARLRLQRLDIESEEVDRQYYKFKQKHLYKGTGLASQLSRAIPVNSWPLENETILPNSNVAMATYPSRYENFPPPSQRQRSNASIQGGNGFGDHRLPTTEEFEPFVGKQTILTQPTDKNPPDCTTPYGNPNFSSVSLKFQQESVISKKPTDNGMGLINGNSEINPRVLVPENSSQAASAEVNQSTFQLQRLSQSTLKSQVGDEQVETSPTHNVRKIKKIPPLNDFSHVEFQNNSQRDLSQNKEKIYILSTEKNHVSAFNLDPILSSQSHLLQEEKTNLETNNINVTGPQPSAPLLNNKERDRNTIKSPLVLDAEQLLQEEVLEAHSSASSSSPKLSVGDNNSKAGEDTEFW